MSRLNPVRRLVPIPLGLAVARARVRRIEPGSALYEHAREQMTFLLGTLPQDGQDDLVERYLHRYTMRSELRWHPGVTTKQPVENGAAIIALASGGVLSFLHHGQYDGMFASIRRATGCKITVVADPGHLRPGADAWRRQLISTLAQGGAVLNAAEGFSVMAERVRQGEILALASDMVGRTPVRFLDRTRIGSFGAARLANETGAPVVVATTHKATRDRTALRLHDPLHPRQFDSGHDLLAAMLKIHETAVRAWPEIYEEPTRRWGVVEPESAELPDRAGCSPPQAQKSSTGV